MKILVTGGAGYIGSHTLIPLLQAGHQVVVIDSLANSSPESLARVKAITGKDLDFYALDLCDAEQVMTKVQEVKPQAVIHLAGLKAVGESVAEPLKYYANNLISTIYLIQAMQAIGCYNLVFSSSATVYGNPDKVPLTEDSPLSAVNPYGQTKLAQEIMLRDLAASDSRWHISVLRYFNPIGAHPSGMIGEDPSGIPNNLFPFITKVAVGQLEQLQVFGNDYPTPDGTCIRDYIHVMDLAQGHLLALEYLIDHPGLEVFNLGTGQGVSVLEAITIFEETNKLKIKYVIVERRPGDTPECYADPSKAHKVLGWQAQHDFAQACRDGWNWQTKNPQGYPKEA